MDEQLLSALNSIPVAELDRADWISVGMALKESGCPVSVWDEWSQNDSRYHKGECARLWNGFRGSSSPVKAGTIVQMAKERGWRPYEGDGCLDWNDAIEFDGVSEEPPQKAVWKPTEDLIKYLELLFRPDEHVAYVTNEVYLTEDGKWVPQKGCYDRTAGELINSLRKHPDDLGYTIGDWKEEAGAWIRFNPVDGTGVKNENVTAFRYALVESDTLPIQEQDELYRRFELPIIALVYSGGKSLHAIVKVDAQNADEYYQRVNFLYDFLEKNGLDIDKQNRNPSRLSRMPGVTRNGKAQYLAATNIGRKSWADWMDYIEGTEDNYPQIVSLADYWVNPPALREPLIDGVLRHGHKMLMSGPSKAGKSMNLMQLAICIAEGIPWLNFPVKKGRILYVNLEIDDASFYNRFHELYQAMEIEPKYLDDIKTLSFRGYALPLNELVPILLKRMKGTTFDAVILDPIYKVMMGDENNASDMGKFSNQFDRICNETGASMIYCHHHSKGAQGAKKAIDRASGSGVFARDPDAIIDLIELEMTDDIRNNVRDGKASAWRMEGTLREFAPFDPLDIWFDYPLHYLDNTGALSSIHPQGSQLGNLSKSSKNTSPEGRKREIDNAFAALKIGNEPPTVGDIAGYLNLTERCIKDRLKEYSQKYYIKRGYVFEKTGMENEEK